MVAIGRQWALAGSGRHQAVGTSGKQAQVSTGRWWAVSGRHGGGSEQASQEKVLAVGERNPSG